MVEIRVVNPPPESGLSTLFSADDPPTLYSEVNWSFGDGGTATGTRPTHTYEEPGEYTVEVDVFQGEGFNQSVAAEDSLTIQVESPGAQQPPDDRGDEPPENGADPTPGTSRDEFLGIVPATAAEGNGIGSDTPGIQPREKAKAQVRRESDGKVLDFFFQAPAKPGIYQRRVDFGDVDRTVAYEVDPFPDDADTGGGGTAPDPEPGPGPLLSIPKPTLESRSIPVAGQTITVPSSLTFGSETFDVRLPSFDAYLASAGFEGDGIARLRDIPNIATNATTALEDFRAFKDELGSYFPGQFLDTPIDAARAITDELQELSDRISEVRDPSTLGIPDLIPDRFDSVESYILSFVPDIPTFQEIENAILPPDFPESFFDGDGLLAELTTDIGTFVDRRVPDVPDGLADLLGPNSRFPRTFDQLTDEIESRVRGLFDSTVGEIDQAVADTQSLVNDEALSSFLSDPRSYVFATFRTEFESRIGNGLLGTLRRILNSILESALSDETRQRLRERAGD